jgi:hypothetical protein
VASAASEPPRLPGNWMLANKSSGLSVKFECTLGGVSSCFRTLEFALSKRAGGAGKEAAKETG